MSEHAPYACTYVDVQEEQAQIQNRHERREVEKHFLLFAVHALYAQDSVAPVVPFLQVFDAEVGAEVRKENCPRQKTLPRQKYDVRKCLGPRVYLPGTLCNTHQ